MKFAVDASAQSMASHLTCKLLQSFLPFLEGMPRHDSLFAQLSGLGVEDVSGSCYPQKKRHGSLQFFVHLMRAASDACCIKSSLVYFASHLKSEDTLFHCPSL